VKRRRSSLVISRLAREACDAGRNDKSTGKVFLEKRVRAQSRSLRNAKGRHVPPNLSANKIWTRARPNIDTRAEGYFIELREISYIVINRARSNAKRTVNIHEAVSTTAASRHRERLSDIRSVV